MIVLVTGGRDYADQACVWHMLDVFTYGPRSLGQDVVLMHGACGLDDKDYSLEQQLSGAPSPTPLRGTDGLADSWARSRGVRVYMYPAAWSAGGRGAGPSRNRNMVYLFAHQEDPIKLPVVFPGGAGTAGCMQLIREANLHLVQVS